MLRTPALLLAAHLAAQEPDRLLAAIPAHAELVVSLAPLDELRQRATTSAWWQLLRDEEVRPLVTELERTFEELLQEGGGEDGEERSEALGLLLDPRRWLAAVHGRAAAYLAMDGDELAGAGFLVEPGQDGAAFEELWNLFLEELRRDSSESTQAYQGVELRVFQPADPAEGLQTLIHCEVEGVHVLSVGEQRAFVLELAQGGIDRLLGKDPAPGFAGDAALAEARAATGPQRGFELFLDPAAFVRFGLADEARLRAAGDPEAAPAEETQATEAILQALGVSAMRYLYLAGDVGADERFDLAFAVHLPSGSLLQRGAALLGPAPRELLALAPADSMSVMIGAVDLPGLFRLVRESVAQFAPEELESFDAGIAAGEAALGMSIEEDLLGLVDGRMASVTLRVPAEELPAEVRALSGEGSGALVPALQAVVLGAEDGDEVSALVSRLLALSGAGAMVEEEDYQGFEIRSLGPDVPLEWACTDEYVVYSPGPTPMRAVLARIGGKDLPTLLSDERFRAVLEARPRAAFLGMGDARVMTEAYLGFFDFLIGMIAGMSAADEDPSEPELARLAELLPSPAIVRKYIDGVLDQALEVAPEGLVLRVGGR